MGTTLATTKKKMDEHLEDKNASMLRFALEENRKLSSRQSRMKHATGRDGILASAIVADQGELEAPISEVSIFPPLEWINTLPAAVEVSLLLPYEERDAFLIFENYVLG